MDIGEAIAYLEGQVPDPREGLPEELFIFATKIVPIVNVDLLIKDDTGRTLLSWRDDQHCGTGWHLPGGIIRYKEPMTARLEKVAETEIGRPVSYHPRPLAVNELIIEPRVRGHFISFLFNCFIPGSFVPLNAGLAISDVGYLRWHETCPDDLIDMHELYREYIDQTATYGDTEPTG